MEPNNVKLRQKPRPNTYAIISIVLAAAPILAGLLLVFLLAVAGSALFGDVGGAFWPFFLFLPMVLFTAGLIADILAVFFGVIVITKRKTFFSCLGIIVVAAEVLLFAAL